MREHKYIRNSSDDPAISSTRSEKYVSTNARSHPRAELKASDHSHSHRSKHGMLRRHKTAVNITSIVDCLIPVLLSGFHVGSGGPTPSHCEE